MLLVFGIDPSPEVLDLHLPGIVHQLETLLAHGDLSLHRNGHLFHLLLRFFLFEGFIMLDRLGELIIQMIEVRQQIMHVHGNVILLQSRIIVATGNGMIHSLLEMWDPLQTTIRGAVQTRPQEIVGVGTLRALLDQLLVKGQGFFILPLHHHIEALTEKVLSRGLLTMSQERAGQKREKSEQERSKPLLLHECEHDPTGAKLRNFYSEI